MAEPEVLPDDKPRLKLTVGPKSDMTPGPPGGADPAPAEGPWSKYAPGGEQKPWEKYSAQGDPDAGGELGRALQRKAKGGASEFALDDLYGRETDKYDYKGAPLDMQRDVVAAAGPEETRLALEKYVANKPEDVGQDKKGRWWVNIDGKKTIVEPEMLSKILGSVPSTMGAGAGAIAGGVLGTMVAPGLGTAAGEIAGAGIGGMIGRGLEDVEKAFKGNYATPTKDEIQRLGWAGLENAGFQAVGPVARGAKETSRSTYRTMIGADRYKDAISRATRIWGDSGGEVIPPVQSYAPEATRMVRGEQNRNLISYGGISPENAQRIEYMSERFKRVLRSSGMPEPEIEAAIQNVISGKSATSGTPIGETIVSKAQRTVEQAQQAISADVDAARNVLRQEETAFRQWTDAKTGKVGAMVEEFLDQERSQFYGHFDAAYSKVNRLGGNARVVDMTEASAAAERLMQTVEPGNVPPLVAKVAGLREEAATLRKQADQMRNAGKTTEADQLENQADALLNRTVEEAHGLRTLLREGMRAQTKGGGPVGTSYHFMSVIEDAVDNEFTNLAKSGAGLPGEAAKELARVDRAYSDGIKFFKNQTVKKITRDAQDGAFAAPEVIARNILNSNEIEAARNIFGRMPPALQEQVLASDMRGKMLRASEQDSVTGEWVVKGKDFLREWQKSKAIHEFYPPAFRQLVERWASELAALDGHLELSAIQNPGQISQKLAEAASKERALDNFVKNNPVGALASNDPHVIDRAVKTIATPGKEKVTKDALNIIGRGTPEWQRVTHWAMIDLFEGAIKKTPAGQTEILGKDVLTKLNSYTKEQQEMLFPNGLAEDIRTLGEDVFALFPRGGDLAMGFSAGSVTNTSIFNLRQLWKQMRFYTIGGIADSQAYLALVADLKRVHPNWEGIKTTLGQMGRAVFNAEEKPPGHTMEQPGGQGASPLEKRSDLGASGEVLSDEGPDPIRPGAQYAANEPTPQQPQSVSPPSDPMSDAAQAAEARGAAAQRQREAVKPAGGRQESEFTESMFDTLIPGRSAVRAAAEGEYGQAALEVGAYTMPVAGKALSAVAKAVPKTVAAAGAALTGLLTSSEAGKIPLTPEQRQKLQMEQQSLKQKQDAAIKDAELRKQEADDKAKRDAEAAERSAKTQADLQERLARIEAEKEQKKAEIEEKRHREEEDAAQRSLDAAKAEAKRMAERPFREKYPEAALGLTMGGMAVAAMLPALSNQQKASAINKYIKEWKKLDEKAAKALESGTAEEKRVAVQRLSDASNKWVETKERLEKPTSLSTKAAVGLAGAEGAALPAEIDFGLQPKESEAHKSAEEFFTNPMEMARVIATYLGGTMAGMTASKFPFKKAEPPVGSGGVVSAYEQQQAAEKKAATAAKRAQTAAKKKETKKEDKTESSVEKMMRNNQNAKRVLRELGGGAE